MRQSISRGALGIYVEFRDSGDVSLNADRWEIEVEGSTIFLHFDVGTNFHVRDKHSHGYKDAAELVKKMLSDGVAAVQVLGDLIAKKLAPVWDRTPSPNLWVIVSNDQRSIFKARVLPDRRSGILFLSVQGKALSDP